MKLHDFICLSSWYVAGHWVEGKQIIIDWCNRVPTMSSYIHFNFRTHKILAEGKALPEHSPGSSVLNDTKFK